MSHRGSIKPTSYSWGGVVEHVSALNETCWMNDSQRVITRLKCTDWQVGKIVAQGGGHTDIFRCPRGRKFWLILERLKVCAEVHMSSKEERGGGGGGGGGDGGPETAGLVSWDLPVAIQ